jgi:hypothetical protein
MSDETKIESTDIPIYGDWVMSRSKGNGHPRSSIYDSDGNCIYEAIGTMSFEEASLYVRGFEYGFKRGEEYGCKNTRAGMRRALGL